MERTPITELEELHLTSAAKGFLKETAKWCFFLSILGFIGMGLMVIFSFFAATIFALMPEMPETQDMPFNMGTFLTIIYLSIAAIYFFPVLYLFKFSTKLKTALKTKDDDQLATAFEKLKSHYKFIGVFAIITISIYVLLFIVGIFTAATL